MGARIIVYKPENKCGYIFKEKKGRNIKRVLTPEPYSKINSLGEEIILTQEETEAWTIAYYQALVELDIPCNSYSECKEVYYKVEEILKRTGNYRFL